MKKRVVESFANGILWLDFYGFVVKINADESLLISLKIDYSFFLGKECAPDLCINAFLEPPDYKNMPPIPSSFITPRNIVFKQRNVSYIDYFGKALSSSILINRLISETVYILSDFTVDSISTFFLSDNLSLDRKSFSCLRIDSNKNG